MSKTKEIVVIALLAAILFIQEQVLMFLPNIQLTVFLLIVYSRCLGLKKTLLVIVVYILLDNLVMGSFNVVFTPFVFIGWALIPLTLCTIAKNVQVTFHLAILAVVFALVYSWIYIIPNVIVYEFDYIAYLMADIPFEILLAVSSFITTLWLYEPCKKVLVKFL